ncbi:30S ribosomal protein S8 [Haliangium ochraceum]|uniref:Small ribosomal subunit protein uS8 n=1 Tax=Haliangium ochraceum (strain DSM 14365 / JCM 11303 / SMP-2) TaxID=502025 RepID=D0LIB1_HALO1|nr:30S ribosomal protein S8 [Haliangium ochraceum]ACY16490.1 ribosomal protein S8 [Haliangium ochraceum DSM 14365]
MSMTDPIADFLTRIRNGIHSRHSSVACPRSRVKTRIAEILRDEGYLEAVTLTDDDKQGVLTVRLRYHSRNACAISGLKRVSKPGQRRYVNSSDVPKVRNGLGVAIISTSQGVMTDRDARQRGVGGEVLCEVW